MPLPVFLLVCMSLLLCTCDSAQVAHDPVEVVATLSYKADRKVLTADVKLPSVKEGESVTVPRIFGFAMDSLRRNNAMTYRLRQNVGDAASIPITVPCGDEACEINVELAPVYVDSFPAELSLGRDLNITCGTQALGDMESVVFIFSPADRSAPERIRLVGPTNGPRTTLPKESLEKLLPGAYTVYLIKNQLRRDTTERLITAIKSEYISRARTLTVSK